MSKLTIVFVFCFLINLTIADVAFMENASHPDHPGKCYIEEYGKAISPGETFRLPKKCRIMTCNKNLSMDIVGCGVVRAEPPCVVKVPGDLSKPHPECCFELVCPESSAVPNEIYP